MAFTLWSLGQRSHIWGIFSFKSAKSQMMFPKIFRYRSCSKKLEYDLQRIQILGDLEISRFISKMKMINGDKNWDILWNIWIICT